MRALLLLAILGTLALPAPLQPGASGSKTALDHAMAEAKAGRTSAAIQELLTLSRGGGSDEVVGQARLELVRIYEGKGEWFNAADQLIALRKMAPNDPEYAYQLGIAYRNISRQALIRMQTDAPGSARVKQIEAEQYATTGDIPRAIQRYKDAVAADPGLAGSHLALAILYARSGKAREAAAEIDQELAIAPESVLARQIKQSLSGTVR